MRLQILHVPDCPNNAVLTQRLGTLIVRRDDVVVEHRVIRDEAEAAARGMTGSPTLLVDGADPFAVAGQSPSLSCRLYTDEAGAISGAPSLAQLRAVLRRGLKPNHHD
jgi:predicted DsbA family dithiol-disulfide isomerase